MNKYSDALKLTVLQNNKIMLLLINVFLRNIFEYNAKSTNAAPPL
jgi:hypothetical protein